MADPVGLLPLKPRVFLMLLVLARGQQHGYALKEALLQQSEGRVNLGPGTLYRTLREMLAAGMIAESSDRPDPDEDDERRRYYRITDFGRRVLEAEAARLTALLDEARSERLVR